ncbi:MAG: dihydrolipoamide acetyltransferase family protein [Candidatus Aminicenantales bacterium]
MAKQFKFPDVGEGITEGEVVRWLVKEGDEIKADQPIAEVETDKAIVEMPSPYAGTVLKLHAREKDIVKVGQVLITVGEKGEKPEEAVPAAVPAAAPKGRAAAAEPGLARPAPSAGAGILATPKVRKMAHDLGLDLAAIPGTGPGGRITEEDVEAAPKKAAAPSPALKVKTKFDFYGSVERLPLRGVRRATAKRMAESVSKAAHVTHFDQADASALDRLREKMKPEVQGIKLTYLPFIVKALVAALKLHPMFNATLDDAEEEIIIKKYYNIGIAVDVPDGLIVPVLKGADVKSLEGIAREIQALAEAARGRTLDLADLKGGTFSITNVGMIGGEAATPIINYPEVAILATLKIADRPRVDNGRIVVQKTLPICLSFDHRVVDGAEAARFMNDLKKILEQEALLTEAVKAAESKA